MRAWRRIKRAALYSLIVAISFVSVVIAINFYDPPLSPEIEAKLNAQPDSVPDSDNLFLAMTGLDAPSGHSIAEEGRIRIGIRSREWKEFMAGRVDADTIISEFPGSLKPPGGVDWCYRRSDVSSFWEGITSPEARKALDQAPEELNQRYLHLSTFKGYAPVPYHDEGMVEPPWMSAAARCLFFSRVAVGFSSEREPTQRQALSLLFQDVALWRRLLAQTDDLMNAASAGRLLEQDYMLLGDGIARQPALAGLIAKEQTLGSPWADLSEWEINRALDTKAKELSLRLLHLPRYRSPTWGDRVNDAIGAHFFKINATVRLVYEANQRLKEAASGDPRGMDDRLKVQEKWIGEHGFSLSPRMLYNPIGRILFAIGSCCNSTFPLRMQDNSAVERLVRLSYEIHLQGVANSDVPAFMAMHPEWSTHPVTGKPFTFDVTSATLEFTSSVKNPAPRTNLLVWAIPPTPKS